MSQNGLMDGKLEISDRCYVDAKDLNKTLSKAINDDWGLTI